MPRPILSLVAVVVLAAVEVAVAMVVVAMEEVAVATEAVAMEAVVVAMEAVATATTTEEPMTFLRSFARSARGQITLPSSAIVASTSPSPRRKAQA